jgi:plastocyanin
MRSLLIALALSLPASMTGAAESKIVDHNMMMDHGDGHLMDMDGGMVMGQNKDKLPGGCDKISEDAHITVHGGHKYSQKFPGTMFAFDTQEWRFKPCTRLTVTFVNEDNIRHQWMMHGLPKYLYDKGMFHLEVTGPGKVTGTLILPKEDKTYLVHCDIAQHMEKGMKGELIVGNGSGTFPSIPGLTDPAIPDYYGPGPAPATVALGATSAKGSDASTTPAPSATGASAQGTTLLSGSLVLGLVLGLFGTPVAMRYAGQRFKGKTTAEAAAEVLNIVSELISRMVKLIVWLYAKATGQKQLPGK